VHCSALGPPVFADADGSEAVVAEVLDSCLLCRKHYHYHKQQPHVLTQYGNQLKLEYAGTAHARPGDTQTASISMHRPQHPEPNRNRVEESQDMENMKLCISTLSIIRSRASTPTPKLTYSQVTAQGKKYNQMDIDQIEQWTSGPLKSEGSNPGNTSISSC
ncbi:17975_t:CDS:2, partial [Gigaspora rosea]